jgi:hypothetical protein
MQQVKNAPHLDEILKGELKEHTNSRNERIEFLYYGEIFESTIGDSIEKVRPFVGLKHWSDGKWTEIGLGIVSENGYSGFWSVHDFDRGIESPDFEMFKKSIDTLSLVKKIEDSTLAHCYYVETKEMTFNKITRTFKGKNLIKDKEFTKEIKKSKKSYWVRNLIIAFTISIILYLIFR